MQEEREEQGKEKREEADVNDRTEVDQNQARQQMETEGIPTEDMKGDTALKGDTAHAAARSASAKNAMRSAKGKGKNLRKKGSGKGSRKGKSAPRKGTEGKHQADFHHAGSVPMEFEGSHQMGAGSDSSGEDSISDGGFDGSDVDSAEHSSDEEDDEEDFTLSDENLSAPGEDDLNEENFSGSDDFTSAPGSGLEDIEENELCKSEYSGSDMEVSDSENISGASEEFSDESEVELSGYSDLNSDASEYARLNELNGYSGDSKESTTKSDAEEVDIQGVREGLNKTMKRISNFENELKQYYVSESGAESAGKFAKQYYESGAESGNLDQVEGFESDDSEWNPDRELDEYARQNAAAEREDEKEDENHDMSKSCAGAVNMSKSSAGAVNMSKSSGAVGMSKSSNSRNLPETSQRVLSRKHTPIITFNTRAQVSEGAHKSPFANNGWANNNGNTNAAAAAMGATTGVSSTGIVSRSAKVPKKLQEAYGLPEDQVNLPDVTNGGGAGGNGYGDNGEEKSNLTHGALIGPPPSAGNQWNSDFGGDSDFEFGKLLGELPPIFENADQAQAAKEGAANVNGVTDANSASNQPKKLKVPIAAMRYQEDYRICDILPFPLGNPEYVHCVFSSDCEEERALIFRNVETVYDDALLFRDDVVVVDEQKIEKLERIQNQTEQVVGKAEHKKKKRKVGEADDVDDDHVDIADNIDADRQQLNPETVAHVKSLPLAQTSTFLQKTSFMHHSIDVTNESAGGKGTILPSPACLTKYNTLHFADLGGDLNQQQERSAADNTDIVFPEQLASSENIHDVNGSNTGVNGSNVNDSNVNDSNVNGSNFDSTHKKQHLQLPDAFKLTNYPVLKTSKWLRSMKCDTCSIHFADHVTVDCKFTSKKMWLWCRRCAAQYLKREE
jgi:hypothetical protein